MGASSESQLPGEPGRPGPGVAASVDAAVADAAAWMSLIYDELHRLAADYLNRERRGHTLQPTELIHEAYLKLAERTPGVWRDAAHFRAVAAGAMRQILIDHARRRATQKHGGGRLRTTLGAAEAEVPVEVDLLELEEALEELSRLDGRKSRVVELRFFAGMTCAEAAAVLSIAPKTAEADWYMARAWLKHRLKRR